jgi:hypothetical protein
MQLSGAPESEAILFLRENHQDSDRHDRYPLKVTASAGASVELLGTDDAPSPNPLAQPRLIKVHFPKGQGYQTMEFTLTW